METNGRTIETFSDGETLVEWSMSGSTLKGMSLDEWVDCLPVEHRARVQLGNLNDAIFPHLDDDGTIDDWAARLPDDHRARKQLANIRREAEGKALAEAYRKLAEMRLAKLEKVIAEDGGGPIVAGLHKRIRELREERDSALLDRDRAKEMRETLNRGALLGLQFAIGEALDRVLYQKSCVLDFRYYYLEKGDAGRVDEMDAILEKFDEQDE